MRSYDQRMTNRRPNLPDLDLLLTVAKEGSLGRAADVLQITQPSVSRRIAALERALGVELLQRTARGSTLTATGRVVIDWAEVLLRSADDFSRSVRALAEHNSPAVRAAVSMTIAEHYAPRWLAQARVSMPDANVSLTVANSAEVADLVESGDVELGIVESPTVRPTLHQLRIGQDHLVVAVATDHPWARRRSVSVEDVSSTPLLVREARSGTRDTIDLALHAKGLRLEVGLEMASNTALKSAAIAGMGPVVVSAVAVAGEVARGQLHVVAVDGLDLQRPLSVIWRRDVAMSSGAGSLLKAVTATTRADERRAASAPRRQVRRR